jgi:hypothetical protein
MQANYPKNFSKKCCSKIQSELSCGFFFYTIEIRSYSLPEVRALTGAALISQR